MTLMEDVVGGGSRELPFPVAVEAAREVSDAAIPQDKGEIFTSEEPLSEVKVEGSKVKVEREQTSDKVGGGKKVEVMVENVASGEERGHGAPAIATSSPDLNVLQNPLGALANWWDSAVTAVAQPLSNSDGRNSDVRQ